MKDSFIIVLISILMLISCEKKEKQIPYVKPPTISYDISNPPKGMKFVSGGEFTMGGGVELYEQPEHKIEVNSFFMDSIEVTMFDYWSLILADEYPGVVTFNGDTIKDDYGLPVTDAINVAYRNYGLSDNNRNMPSIRMSRSSAIEYCNARSKRDGFDTVYVYDEETGKLTIRYEVIGYRLPTEAEWEYAARGGTSTRYYWGDDLAKADEYEIIGNEKVFNVATKKPNPYGLYDMLGNAAEFCNDYFSLMFYEYSPEKDPIGPQYFCPLGKDTGFLNIGDGPTTARIELFKLKSMISGNYFIIGGEANDETKLYSVRGSYGDKISPVYTRWAGGNVTSEAGYIETIGFRCILPWRQEK